MSDAKNIENAAPGQTVYIVRGGRPGLVVEVVDGGLMVEAFDMVEFYAFRNLALSFDEACEIDAARG